MRPRRLHRRRSSIDMALRRGVGLSDRRGELPHPRPAHRRAGRTPDPHRMKAVGTANIPLYAEFRVCPALSTERIMEILTDLTCNELRRGGLLIQTFTRTRPHAVLLRTRLRLPAGPAKVAERPTSMAGRGRRLSGAAQTRRDAGVKESRKTVKIPAVGRHKGRLSLFAADDGADDVGPVQGGLGSDGVRVALVAECPVGDVQRVTAARSRTRGGRTPGTLAAIVFEVSSPALLVNLAGVHADPPQRISRLGLP